MANYTSAHTGIQIDAAVGGAGFTGDAWYIDSVSGNDSTGDGSVSTPYATWAKVKTVAAEGDLIFIKRGSVLREQVEMINHAWVRPYGETGDRPIVSGADILSNASFTAHSGTVYKISVSPASTTNSYASVTSDDVLMVWEDDVRLGYHLISGGFASLAALEGSSDEGFYWDDATNTLYIRTTDGSDPSLNGRVYEASTRTLAIHGGDGFRAEGLVGEKAGVVSSVGQQGYGILGYKSGEYIDCIGRHSWNHAVGVANSETAAPLIFDRCGAYDCEKYPSGATPPTLFVAFKGGSGAPCEVHIRDCWAKQPTAYVTSYNDVAFYGHGTRTVLKYFGVNYAESINYICQLVNDTTDRAENHVFGTFSGKDCYNGIAIYDRPGHRLSVDFDNVHTGVSARYACEVTGTMINPMTGVSAINLSANNFNVHCHDMLFARRTAPSTHLDGSCFIAYPTVTISAHDCIVHQVGSVWRGTGANDPVSTAEGNFYSGCIRIYKDTGFSPTYSESLATWQSVSGVDADASAAAQTIPLPMLAVRDRSEQM